MGIKIIYRIHDSVENPEDIKHYLTERRVGMVYYNHHRDTTIQELLQVERQRDPLVDKWMRECTPVFKAKTGAFRPELADIEIHGWGVTLSELAKQVEEVEGYERDAHLAMHKAIDNAFRAGNEAVVVVAPPDLKLDKYADEIPKSTYWRVYYE